MTLLGTIAAQSTERRRARSTLGRAMTPQPRRRARRLVIDCSLVEQRRLAAGITHTQLAQRGGAGAVTDPPQSVETDNDHDSVVGPGIE